MSEKSRTLGALKFIILNMGRYDCSLSLYLSLQKDMVKRRHDAYNGLSSLDFSVVATEYTPLFKWLGSRASSSVYIEEDEMIDLMLNDQESMISEDEIEDW